MILDKKQDENSESGKMNEVTNKIFDDYKAIIKQGKEISLDCKERLKIIQERNREWDNYEENTRKMINDKTMISFNVSGKCYQISGEMLLKYKNTFFYELISSNQFDYSKEIVLNRPSKYFKLIISFYRDNSLPLWKLNNCDIAQLLIESDYFQIDELSAYIKKIFPSY